MTLKLSEKIIILKSRISKLEAFCKNFNDSKRLEGKGLYQDAESALFDISNDMSELFNKEKDAK